MDVDSLFLETVADLRRRSNPAPEYPAPEYELQQLAALLRKLLLDGQPLIDAVNRTRRLPIRFLVADGSPFQDVLLGTGPIFYALQDGFDPETVLVANARIAEVDRDGLLGRGIVLMDGV